MNSARLFLLCVLGAGFAAAPAVAADLNGVWSTDASLCTKIFKKQGASVSFQDDSDIYGSGFVIESGRILTKSARCSIKSQKTDGPIVHVLASCATDIMLSNVQISIKVLSDDRISRFFPEMPDIDQNFERCRL